MEVLTLLRTGAGILSSVGIRALMLCMACAPAVHAQESIQLVEQQIKAGLLYNFMKYTDWPADVAPELSAPMVVCLFGGDPFSGRLQPMAGRTVNQHVIELRELHAVDELRMCSLVFVHADAMSQWPQLRMALADKAMLTVSDFPGFADSGGMIEFTRNKNRIGIKIGAGAVMAAHLDVQDRLQRLANSDGAGAR
jgi:hypothetical protein